MDNKHGSDNGSNNEGRIDPQAISESPSATDDSTPVADGEDKSATVEACGEKGTTVEDLEGTLDELIKMDEELEDTAVALLGGSLDLVCTYSEGYKSRQPLYSCKTCFQETGQLAGICYACSENCHDGHDLVEMYSKRHFCCDCGNSKFRTKCKLFEEKDAFNKRNKYNDNFKGIFCSCKKPYPPDENDADASTEDMIQCNMCEDWFHPSHIFPPDKAEGYAQSDDIEGLICKDCVVKYPFLAFYPFGNEMSNEPNPTIGGQNAEGEKSDGCKLEAFKMARERDSRKEEEEGGKSVWAEVGWRSQLCRCTNCTNLYEDLDCSFLLDSEDTIAYFEQQNREQASQKDAAKKDLFQMVDKTNGRETALHVVASIEHMKQHCKQFFETRFAEKRGPITDNDVEQCFAELRVKRQKLEDALQQSELNKNGPWTQ